MARILLTTLMLLTLAAPGWCDESYPWPGNADAWAKAVGQTLTLEGDAVNGPVGAMLTNGPNTVKVGLQDSWPEVALGHKLRVTGRLAIKKPDVVDPNPKPEGVDNATETLYYLEGPNWTRLDD